MTIQSKLRNSRQDYSEEFLYSEQDRKNWDKRDFQGGIYSDSEVGGQKQDQQNPWQGSQDQAKSERP